MMPLLDDMAFIRQALGLLVGIPMILAGLRLFKLWLAVLGFLSGCVLGALLGGGMAIVMEMRGDAPLATMVLMGLAGGVAGALLAWPLQKLFVFVTAGFLAAIAAYAAAALVGVAGELAFVLGVLAFFAGGILSVWAYQYLIIISLAAGGASALFDAYVGNRAFRGGMTSLDDFITLVTMNAWQYVLILGTTILFALYLQRWSRARKGAGPVVLRRAFLTQRAAVLFGFLLTASYLAQAMFPRILAVTMLGPMVWFALALILPPLVSVAGEMAERLRVPPPAAQYLLYPMVALIVTPAVAWAQGILLFGIVVNPFAYLSVGFGGAETALKLAYAFLVLPALGMTIVPGAAEAVPSPASLEPGGLNERRKVFQIFEGPDGRCEAVKQGWSWPAFLLPWLWALIKGLWPIGIVTTLAMILTVVLSLSDPALEMLFGLGWLGVSVVFGLNGNDWRQRSLTSRGWVRRTPVTAVSATEAKAVHVRTTTEPPPSQVSMHLSQEAHVVQNEGGTSQVLQTRGPQGAQQRPGVPTSPSPSSSTWKPWVPTSHDDRSTVGNSVRPEAEEANLPSPEVEPVMRESLISTEPSAPEPATPPTRRTFIWPEWDGEVARGPSAAPPQPSSSQTQPDLARDSVEDLPEEPTKGTTPGRLSWPERRG